MTTSETPEGVVVAITPEVRKELCEAIGSVDPEPADITRVLQRSDLPEHEEYEVTLADGAVWRVGHDACLGVCCRLVRLGSGHQACPLAPDVAVSYVPTRQTFDEGDLEIPAVDCMTGYRQLEWREKVLPRDEWYAGKLRGWQRVGEGSLEGAHYRPTHSNSRYAKHAVIRRKRHHEEEATR